MKNKGLFVLLGALGVLVITLAIIMVSGPKSDSSVTGDVVASSKLSSEADKFAKFTADMACTMAEELSSSESMEDAFAVLSKTESIADKYGFEMSELETLSAKYQNDLAFQSATLGYVNDMCPELAEMADLSY